MPNKIDGYWQRLILNIKAEHDDWGSTKIRNAVIAAAIAQGYKEEDAPKLRTFVKKLKRIKDDEKEAKAENRTSPLAATKRVSFPESFGDEEPLLPWAAAPYVIEFINMYPKMQVGKQYDSGIWDGYDRPTVRAAKNYYRIALATGEENKNVSWGFIRTRCIMAMQLAFAEITINPVLAERTRRKVEGWLLYEPWIKLHNDDGKVVQRFKDYEQYVIDLDNRLPNTGRGTQDPMTDMELIELGIRPDQYADFQKKFLEDMKKDQEKNNAEKK